MKIRRTTDRKKEILAVALVAFIVVVVSVYVVYLVNRLTQKVYQVFGRPTDAAGSFTHFDFAKFEELGLRPPLSTSSPATIPTSTVASSTASSS